MSEGKMFKTAIHYGSLSGIAVIVFYIALYYGGFNVFGQMSFLGVWIPIVFLVMATKYHRSHNLGGFMTYRQGLAVGFATTIFSITLFGLFFYLFGTVIATNLLDLYKSQAAESLEQGKGLLSERMMDKAFESIDTMTISSLAFSESFNKMIGGVIATLIIAAIYRRKQQSINEA